MGTLNEAKLFTSFSHVTGDHSFKHGYFQILIQYLTTALETILFISVVMVLAFGVRSLLLESRLILIFLPCIYSSVSLLRTLFVRLIGALCDVIYRNIAFYTPTQPLKKKQETSTFINFLIFYCKIKVTIAAN